MYKTQRHREVYLYAGLLATFANIKSQGFRQKDVKFYIELLSNWMESTFKGPGIELQNTQIQRFLDQLCKEHVLKKSHSKTPPLYTMPPIGTLEIITRLVTLDLSKDLEDFIFLFHFIKLYSNKMEQLLLDGRDQLPKSYILEMKHLLNPENLLELQIQKINLEIEKLDERINDAQKMSELAKSLFKQNNNIDDVVQKMEELYPYQLNYQKKMGVLFKELSDDIKYLEMSSAPQLRAETLWGPLKQFYQSYRHILLSLSK